MADEEKAIEGLSREQLVARYVEAGIDRADVEAHVDAIMRERDERLRDGSRHEDGRAIVAGFTTAELDQELISAGIEPESLRRIARQVFAQFGVDEAPPSRPAPTSEGLDPEPR